MKNHVANSHMRVMVALLEGTTIIIDENGNPCSFNTTTHNPLDLILKSDKKGTN